MTASSVIQLSHPRGATPVVTQTELSLLLSLHNRARQLTEQIQAAEASIRARLAVGVTVEDVPLRVYLEPGERVEWKPILWKRSVMGLSAFVFGILPCCLLVLWAGIHYLLPLIKRLV